MTRRRRSGSRSGSSGHWRERQADDPYFQKAKQEGYRARSAYKLIQIDDKFRILHPGQAILDLGAAPGSWSQVAAKRTGSGGRVVALDLQPIEPIPGVTTIQGDMTRAEVQAEAIEAAGGPVDVVLSDAAPNTSGIRIRDHAFSIALVYAALEIARHTLRQGGDFVAKVFEGEDLPQLLVDLRAQFELVKPFYPDATHREGYEVFVVCKGYKGAG
ncbi:MAG: RlmE family RNA methyltransferase [Anaerolineae bacterium]|nr:RlmE family RNA methyltransferase [Anaerolineae bacterium]